MELSFKQMYQAILDKDIKYEDIFFTVVKTTGIFCRPTCTARRPKPENIEFCHRMVWYSLEYCSYNRTGIGRISRGDSFFG